MVKAYSYTTPGHVARFLQEAAYDANSNPSIGTIQSWIRQAEAYIDQQTRNTWKLTRVPVHAYKIELSEYYDTGIPIYLRNRSILQLNASAGDTLEVWDGTQYEDWLATKTEGRIEDYWLDYEKGILYLRTTRYTPISGVRISYRFNSGNRTLINNGAGLAQGATTVTVDSTSGFPEEGMLRINDEDIFYNGKTATTFTGLSRGQNGTVDSAHADNDPMLFVPEDIQEAALLHVAILRLTNSNKTVRIADSTNGVVEQHGPRLSRYETQRDALISARREWGAGF